MAKSPEDGSFSAAVRASLNRIIGDSGAKAVLYYVGDPAPDTFESKLTTILGDGATRLIIQDIKAQEESQHPRSGRRSWFGGGSKGHIWNTEAGGTPRRF